MNVLNANEVDTKKMVKIVNFVMYICHNKKKKTITCVLQSQKQIIKRTVKGKELH